MGGNRMKRRAFLSSALATSGCAVVPRLPQLQQFNTYAQDIDISHRRPIVTIPGILGSRLRDGPDGEIIWGGPSKLSLDPTGARSIRKLALPIGDGQQPLNKLIDGVEQHPSVKIETSRTTTTFTSKFSIPKQEAARYEWNYKVEGQRSFGGFVYKIWLSDFIK